MGLSTEMLSKDNIAKRVQSATTGMGSKGAYREPNIRLGSGAGPSSNIFSVKNGKLMLTN